MNNTHAFAYLIPSLSRYGYTPLPKSISKHTFESRLRDATISEDLRNLALKWYTLDMNHISSDNSTGIYVLKNLDEAEQDIYWSDVYPRLLNLFDGLPFDMDNDDLLINRSVTEYEIKLAMKKGVQERVFWFYRKFSGGVMKSDEKFLDYNDTLQSIDKKRHYDDLIEWMEREIPTDRVRRYEECSYESYVKKDSLWTQQFDKWCEDVTEVLSSSLQNIILQRSSWDQDGCGLGLLD